MGTKLGWIRECWSLLVTNLSQRVTTKILFDVFREAGPVFCLFCQEIDALVKVEGTVLFASKQNGMPIGQPNS